MASFNSEGDTDDPLRLTSPSVTFNLGNLVRLQNIGSTDEESLSSSHRMRISRQAHQDVETGFAALVKVTKAKARSADGQTNGAETVNNKWLRAQAVVGANAAAKKLRHAAQLKSLQRTPYSLVLSRIKLLVERIKVLASQLEEPMKRSSGSGNPAKLTRPLAVRTPSSPAPPHPKRVSSAKPSLSSTMRGSTEEEDLMRETMQKLLDELSVMLIFVSEFFRKLPEETLLETCAVVSMDSLLRNQVVYREGEAGEKFYIVVAGSIELSVELKDRHQRRRTILSILKKGHIFGEQELLNGEVRVNNATTLTNCMLLSVGRADFLQVLGPYFRSQQRLLNGFFTRNVSIMASAAEAEVEALVQHMHRSTFPAGREWEWMSEMQVFFIKEGVCQLESVDRKAASALLLKVRDDPTVPTLSETGVLANVEVHEGRAVGTLGQEEELKRLRRERTKKLVIAELKEGAFFGGGVAVTGEGEYQSALKVVSLTPVELYHLHLETFLRYATRQMMQALRDDVAFKLTYFYGRLGTVGPNQVIGHPFSQLQPAVVQPSAGESSAPLLRGEARRVSRRTVAGPLGSEGADSRDGSFGAEVNSVLLHVHQLEEGFQRDVASLKNKKGQPAERYWLSAASPTVTPYTSLTPTLASIYPEGLEPLAEKLDQLMARAQSRQQKQRPATATTKSEPSAGQLASCQQEGLQNWQGEEGNTAAKASVGVRFMCPPSTSAEAWQAAGGIRSKDCSANQGLQPRVGTSQSLWEPDGTDMVRHPGGNTPTLRPQSAPAGRSRSRSGSLTAASVLWTRTSGTPVPPLRQCLTYEEIYKEKTRERLLLQFGDIVTSKLIR